MPVPYSPSSVRVYTRTPIESPTTCVLPQGHRSSPLGRMISSYPNYLHADVSDGEDLSRHQQEEEEGTGVTSDVVKVQGEDPATPGPLT